jgi:hypothetical protein
MKVGKIAQRSKLLLAENLLAFFNAEEQQKRAEEEAKIQKKEEREHKKRKREEDKLTLVEANKAKKEAEMCAPVRRVREGFSPPKDLVAVPSVSSV